MNAFLVRVVWTVPLCLGLGFLVADYVDAKRVEEQIVMKQVAQRLGTWAPPALSESEREALLAERDVVARTIERLERRR